MADGLQIMFSETDLLGINTEIIKSVNPALVNNRNVFLLCSATVVSTTAGPIYGGFAPSLCIPVMKNLL